MGTSGSQLLTRVSRCKELKEGKKAKVSRKKITAPPQGNHFSNLSSRQSEIQSISLHWMVIFLAAYLGFFSFFQFLCNGETRVSNWDPDVPMFVGSDGTARHAWKGQIAKLQVWNRALSEESARKNYFRRAPRQARKKDCSPRTNSVERLPSRIKEIPARACLDIVFTAPDSNVLDLDGNSWLSTKASVTKLAEDFQRDQSV